MIRKRIVFSAGKYFSQIHLGIARYAQEKKWHLDSSPALKGQVFFSGAADGVLTGLGVPEDQISFLENLSCPAVHIGAPPFDDLYCPPCIYVDHKLVAKAAFEHFESLYLNNFACYSSYPDYVAVRIGFFKKIVEESGRVCNVLQVTKAMSEADKVNWLVDSIKKLPKPLAMFTINNEAAMELIEICIDHGIRVPDEVAVIGVSSNQQIIDETTPVPITTVEIGHERVGYEAARLLDRLMHGEKLDTNHVKLTPKQVIVRQSTDILAIPHPEVLKAVDFINKNFMHHISVDDIVKVTKLTKVGLYKAFKKHLNINPGQYLNETRLKKALEMLSEKEAKVGKVAEITGFTEYRALNQAVKNATGLTPKEYQRQYSGRL